MTEFDDILKLEQQRQYSVDNSDLLTFATLTQIAHEEAQTLIKRRFKISVILTIVAMAALFQLLALSQFSFTSVSLTLSRLVQQYPYAITLANLGFVGILLIAKRFRLI